MAARGVVLDDEEAFLVCSIIGEARARLSPEARPRLTRREQALLKLLSQAAADHRLVARMVPINEAARMTGTSPRTLRDQAQRGLLPAVRDGHRWLVEVA